MSTFASSATASTLQRRSEFLRAVRDTFFRYGFTEVQPPILSSEFVIDRHIDPIAVRMPHPNTRDETTFFLQSSPEAAMKRVMASTGLDRIYSIGPVFRRDESGPLHNPEFIMAEWYRVGDTLADICKFAERLLAVMLGVNKATYVRFADAFNQYTQQDLFSAELDSFAKIADEFQLGVSSNFSDDWDDWVNLIFSQVVQPNLGKNELTFITHFPISQAALAKRSDDDPRTAERFEIFYRGIELANGYCELLDADELERRCQAENELRCRDGKTPLPIPERLIAAIRSGLPVMSGCAMGLDRILALDIGLPTIKEVMCFPTEQA